MLGYLIVLTGLLLAAFVITVVVQFLTVKGPDDGSRVAWFGLTAMRVAHEWFTYARDSVRGFQLWIRGRPRKGNQEPAAPLPPRRPMPGGNESRPLPPPPPDRPAAVLTLSGVPADHATVHERIAAFEPETDEDWRAFLEGEARAALSHADAWLAHAEGLANAVGLDPAVLEAVTLLADAHADMAEMNAVVAKRLDQAYALVYEHLDSDGTLPYDGDWLGKAG